MNLQAALSEIRRNSCKKQVESGHTKTSENMSQVNVLLSCDKTMREDSIIEMPQEIEAMSKNDYNTAGSQMSTEHLTA